MSRPFKEKNMNEQEFFEALGRKQVELDKLSIEYSRLLIVLSQVVSGQTAIDQVSVDLATRSWKVTPVVQIPEGPGPGDQVQ